jgi:putative ABC transport system substrate-binding protein
MKRRYLLAAASAATLPRLALAQKPVPRIGVLVAGDPEPAWTLFKKAMTALGYIEGRTVAFEYRAADANGAPIDALAADLVRLKVDVIVAILTPSVVAAQRATSTIPIVFFGAAPDNYGVTNVARPDGNITGVFSPSSTLAGKGLQLFREIKPAAKTFGVLLNAQDAFHVPLLRDMETVARAEKIELVTMFLGSRDEMPKAFEAMVARAVDGVLVQPSLGLQAAAELALKYRVPTISFRREFADAGGLFSYGSAQPAIYAMVAEDVDKALKGTSPKNLPVQQASRMELIVNQKTAKALGMTLPPLFLAQADEVIE